MEVEDVLDYSRKLAKFADEEDLMPGLGHVSLAGGVLAQEGKAREVCEGGEVWGGVLAQEGKAREVRRG